MIYHDWMCMNNLFLIFPIVLPANPKNPELSYLKAIAINNANEVTEKLIDIYRQLSYIDHESYNGFYDQAKLSALIKEAKRLTPGKKYPEADRILRLFTNKPLFAYNASEKVSKLNINGIDVHDGIICRYYFHEGENTLVDTDSLSCKPQSLVIKDDVGTVLHVNVIPCLDTDLYNWFLAHRNPERILDVNYRKHTNAPKNGYRGVISALTYSEEETKEFLKKAVGIQNGKNLFFKDETQNKIIVFWNENISLNPTYHAYEISADDEAEIDKIYRKGGRTLNDKINKYAKK